MSSRELTSAEMTFQSFRHGQGSEVVQKYIFAYHAMRYGISAALYPEPKEVQRYVRYITADTGRHLPVDRAVATDLVYKNFLSLIAYLVDGRVVDELVRSSPQAIVPALGKALLGRETEIFGTHNPWGSEKSNQAVAQRRSRVGQRIASGHPSWLLHHGRDQHPTAYAQYDTMYRDVWQSLQANAHDEEVAAMLGDHAAALAAAAGECGQAVAV